jgi:drug/metabolite transporter (DMT)-like permease
MRLSDAEPLVQARLDARAFLLMTVLCLCWGLQQPVIKLAALDGLPTLLQAGLRSVSAAAAVCLWVAWREGGAGVKALFAPDATGRAGVLIGLAFAIEFVFLYLGLQHTTASRGVLFLYTAPFFVAIGVHLWVPAERLGFWQMLGLLSAFVGVALALSDRLEGGGTLLGDGLEMLAAVFWAITIVMTKAIRALRLAQSARVVFLQLAVSTPFLLGLAFASGAWAEARPSLPAFGLLLYQSLLVAFVTYLAWYWLIVHYPAGRLSAFSFLTPLFGILAGALLLHEPVSPSLLLALVFVAVGLYLVNGRNSGPRPSLTD